MEYEIIYESHPIPLTGVLMDEHTLVAALARGDLCPPVVVRKPKGRATFRLTPDGLEPFRSGNNRLFKGNPDDLDEETLQEVDDDPNVWFGIRGFPRYEVSNHGQVRSLALSSRRLLRPNRVGRLLRYTLRDEAGLVRNMCLQEILSLKESGDG